MYVCQYINMKKQVSQWLVFIHFANVKYLIFFNIKPSLGQCFYMVLYLLIYIKFFFFQKIEYHILTLLWWWFITKKKRISHPLNNFFFVFNFCRQIHFHFLFYLYIYIYIYIYTHTHTCVCVCEWKIIKLTTFYKSLSFSKYYWFIGHQH